MNRRTISSWGRTARVEHTVLDLVHRGDPLPEPRIPVLPYGLGRSYGDSCLNPGGALIMTRALDRFIDFDPATGVLTCEAGVTLDEILRIVVPQGWFLAVTPGTRFVTVGGAIANDVHGKNHHVAGTFGCHVRRFELLRSQGERIICSLDENPALFAATIGGLGLTGLITWAEIQLQRIRGEWINVEHIRFHDVDEFLALCAASDRDFQYSVSWLDCAGGRKRIGRGIFMRGNHAPAIAHGTYSSRTITLPFTPPLSLVNPLSVRAFNTLYFHRSSVAPRRFVQHYEPFFYPLDGIREWNRMYGPTGFYQYQCVLPLPASREGLFALLTTIADSGLGSFLAVLKLCGDRPSPGMLSFPRQGVSLALDFPNHSPRLPRLFERLDAIVTDGGGRLYPAKDARMSGAMFRAGYPRWTEFEKHIDPGFSSGFWRRISEAA